MEYIPGSIFDANKRRIAETFQKSTTSTGAQRGMPIGTKKEMGGRMMIKTADGWVPDSQGKKGQAANEERKIHGGQGAKVVEGSHVTNKEGFTGEVHKVDDHHAHIKWKDKEGKEQVTKVSHDTMHEKMTAGEFKHHVPADQAHEATGAAAKEAATDPAEIKDKEQAFDQLSTYFKGDEEAERTIKFLKDTIGKNDKVRFDPGMTFDDDRILGLSYPDGRFGVNVNSPHARDKESVYRTMMHEMVHAATRQEMKTNETLQDEFNGVLSEVRKHMGLPDDGTPAANDALVKQLYANGDIGEDKYGASDQYELVAEVFTNPKFAALLKSIPYKKDNLLKKVMTSIFAAFSKTSKKVKDAKKDLKDVDNMADYLVGLTEKVFKPEVKKEEGKKEGKAVKMDKKENKAAAKMAGVKKSEDMSALNAYEFINDSDVIQKAGTPAVLGEKRTFMVAGKPVAHVKVAGGWRRMKAGESVPHVARPDTGSHGIPKSLEQEEPKAENPKVDINERFAAAGRFVKAVIAGAVKSTILYGTGGVGKTYEVTKRLDMAGKVQYNEDKNQPANLLGKEGGGEGDEEVEEQPEEGVKSTNYDWIKVTGYMSTPEVYKLMFEHNGKTLVFDDCDRVLQDGNTVNLFKGALDTSGDGTIFYGTKSGVKSEGGGKLPKSFQFTGKAIFISNLSNDQVPQPIKSRALRADLTMSPQQTIERLKFIAKNQKTGELTNLHFKGVPSYTHKEMSDIIDFLDKHKNNTSDLNVRTVGAMLAIKKIADAEGEDWRKDAEHMIFSKSEDSFWNGGIMKANQRRVNSIYKSGDAVEALSRKGAVKSLEFRDKDVDKAMGTGNTPGFETVEKSMSDSLNLLFKSL